MRLWSVLAVTLPSAAVLASRTWDVRPWVTWLGCVVLAPAEGDSAHGIVWSISLRGASWEQGVSGVPSSVPAEGSLCASGPAAHTGPSGTTSAASRMAPVPAVDVKLRGPRTSVLGFLVIGSVFVVFWKWDSFSWHARGMILAAYGVVCLVAGLIPALRTRGLLESGAQAQGTVVDVKKDTSSGQYGGSTYNPVVRFTAVDGRTVEFTSAVGYSRSPDIGGAVPVRYRRGDPEQAEIDRATMWMIPAAFGLVGGLGLLVAAVIVYSSPREQPCQRDARYWAAWCKGRSGPIRVHPVAVPDVHNGPMSRADFNQYWGDPASLHFVRGYDVIYDSNDASDGIEVTLFQFATPADAAAFKADSMPGLQVKSKADPVIPGADDYNFDIPRSGHIHPRRDRDQRQPGVRDRKHKRQRRSGTPGGDDGAPAVCRALMAALSVLVRPKCGQGNWATTPARSPLDSQVRLDVGLSGKVTSSVSGNALCRSCFRIFAMSCCTWSTLVRWCCRRRPRSLLSLLLASRLAARLTTCL